MRNSPSPIVRVAVLGANGQVGVELCYLLSIESGLHPVAVARSEYSLALLRKMGLECRVAASDEELVDILADCDALLDLVHPSLTNVAEMRKAIVERCQLLHDKARPGASIIYASTLAVYQLYAGQPAYSIYGRTKLLGECEHLRLGRKNGRHVVVLRFGEVHGALQGVSLSLIETLKVAPKIAVPDTKSIAVFVSTISEAIVQIVEGKVPSGTYSLVSPPEWSYAELAQWLAKEAGTKIAICTEALTQRPSLLSRVGDSVRGGLRSYGLRHKDEIADWLWYFAPALVSRVAFEYRSKQAAAQIAADWNSAVVRPFSRPIRVPGLRIATLSDARVTMPPKHALVKAALARLKS